MKKKWPKSLDIYAYSHKTDGGTAILYCVDEQKDEHIIQLGQQWQSKVPGAGLFSFDGQAIAPRSGDEASILALLDSASETQISREFFPAEKIRGVINKICNTVRSDAYVNFLKQANPE